MIKTTHTDAQTKYDVKEKHISFGAIVHIVARAVGASTWTERVGTQQWHLHPTVFISAHNGAGLHLHGPERLQFSALGEKWALYKKGPFKGSHSTRCQGGFNESADRHRKYNLCLLFKEGREKVEKRLHQQQRGRRRWDQVMFYGSSEVFRSWFNLEA